MFHSRLPLKLYYSSIINHAKHLKHIYRLNSSLTNQIDISDPATLKYLENAKAEYWELKMKPHLQRFESTRIKELLPIVKTLEERSCVMENLKSLNELNEEKDKDMLEMMEEEKKVYSSVLREINEKLIKYMSDPEVSYSVSESFIEVSAGVGGQEAMLFAGELFEMYTKFVQYKGWHSLVQQWDVSEIGGVRKAVLAVEGSGCWEALRWEAGVHRVQRVPATERGGRLHTSTCSVAVLLQPSEIEVNIPDRDVRIETKRATGAGGQHVNTTDSAVRVVHLPTGLAVECQTEREQHKNKKFALARLRALLYQQQEDKRVSEERANRKSQVGSGLRNEKIRTYNYNQDRVTDHRLGSSGTVHDLKGVLNGGAPLDALMKLLQRTNHARETLERIQAFREKQEASI